ncbi:hypothetical protein [Magnetofaba australis]|uniref:Putative YkoY family integral membrane protein n=1 Tax=Magnetofaba australis IT-1 TaxID=1434232 RepID=A0A1Y2K1C1_9PROT|nr:hypothetical protein [Magnetofaba australis]OSM00101.1 putative YkoY family integral membrane protein [Magnetofaba australis IT-1]
MAPKIQLIMHARRLIIIVALTLFACLTAAFGAWLQTRNLLINHDLVWCLEIARVLTSGGRYLHEALEVNPPLFFLLISPFQWLATLLHLSDYAAVALWINLLAVGAALVCWPPLRALIPNRALTMMALLGIAAVLMGHPGYHFGQREQLIATLITPGLFWLPWRLHDPTPLTSTMRMAGAAVTVLAALGILIKPHYLLMPLAALIATLILRPEQRALRPLWLGWPGVMTVVCAAYGFLITVFFPEYFQMVGVALDLYGGMDASANTLLSGPILSFVGYAALLAFGVSIATGWRAQYSLTAWSLWSACALGMAAFVLQGKGWAYHTLAATICMDLLTGAALIATLTTLRHNVKSGRTLVSALIIGGALWAKPITGGWAEYLALSPSDWRTHPGVRLLQVAAQGEGVMLVSNNPRPWTSQTDAAGSRLSQRGYLWMLAGALQLMEQGDAVKGDYYAKRIRTYFAEDLRRFRPRVLIIGAGRDLQSYASFHGGFVAFLEQDPEVKALMRDYPPLRTLPNGAQIRLRRDALTSAPPQEPATPLIFRTLAPPPSQETVQHVR